MVYVPVNAVTSQRHGIFNNKMKLCYLKLCCSFFADSVCESETLFRTEKFTLSRAGKQIASYLLIIESARVLEVCDTQTQSLEKNQRGRPDMSVPGVERKKVPLEKRHSGQFVLETEGWARGLPVSLQLLGRIAFRRTLLLELDRTSLLRKTVLQQFIHRIVFLTNVGGVRWM